MKIKRIIALGLSLALVGGLLAGCGKKDEQGSGEGIQEMKLKLAHSAATSHAHHTAAVLFADRVKELTDGKVEITVYPASELGDQPSLVDQCYNGGDVDIVIASQSNMATYMPKVNAVAAPFLFDDYDHAHRTIDDYILPWINESIQDEMNMYALGVFDYGFRHVTTQDIVVKTADDVKGLKIRVPPAAGLQATFAALDANTQTIAYSELYQSLKQGVVAAEENPIATIVADCYYECQNQLALTGHYFDLQALLINKDLWNGMSPELQEIFKKAGQEAAEKTRELISGSETEGIETLKSHGMTVTEVDKQSFIDKMQPAYDEMAKLAGQEEMDNLLAAVEKNRK